MNHKRLFIPGPTEVRSEILQALATPQIGHRTKDYSALHERCVKKLRQFLNIKDDYETKKDDEYKGVMLIFTCSSSGVMEASIRNTVAKKCLNFVNGAFSDRWSKITVANGIPCTKCEVDWKTGLGRAITPEIVLDELAKDDYDAITVVWNETSTGVMSPIPEIGKKLKEKYPNVMFLVDAVSNMAGVKMYPDELGIDVLLAGVQKAFALPPGLAVGYISRDAMKKAESVKNRGLYLDFIDLAKRQKKDWQTPSTPSIPHMFALDKQMDFILAEGEKRFARHKALADVVREYARKNWGGAKALYPEAPYFSDTLTCINNTRGISIAKLNNKLGEEYMQISNGYGDLKEKTFRIAHMGDTQMWEIEGLLEAIERIINKYGNELKP